MSKEDVKKVMRQAAQEVIAAKTSATPTAPQQPAEKPSQGTLIRAQFERDFFRGPLPPPELLKAYGEALPDGADRIVKMAEREQTHVHRMDLISLVFVGMGQILGFLIVMAGVGGGLWLVFNDKPISGFTGFFSGLAVLMGGGYLARSKPSKENSKTENGKARKTQ